MLHNTGNAIHSDALRRKILIFLFISSSILIFVSPVPYACAGDIMEKFTDPVDGNFDVSNWLLDRKGFLTVPIIITEPAVGYGGGLGLIFFHESLSEKEAQVKADFQEDEVNKEVKLLPPSISGVAGAKTENNSWFLGGFHFGSWKKDQIRYLGGLGKVSANITFYGRGESSRITNGFDYNVKGWGALQELKFRIEKSDVFVGGKFIYYDIKNTFDFSQRPADIEEWELDYRNLGLGFVFEYDSRDNIFTPRQGTNTSISVMLYNGEGKDSETREYQMTDISNRWYRGMLSDRIIIGWRAEANLSSGGVPFYALPSISLRGIPVARYQGKHVIETEIEAMYLFSGRWGVVPFGGVGRTADSISDFGESKNLWAGGVGIRYLIARRLKLMYGIDIARGPEDWVFYIQVGSGL
jgi:hypothetical protein